jgi:hypothetical protein
MKPSARHVTCKTTVLGSRIIQGCQLWKVRSAALHLSNTTSQPQPYPYPQQPLPLHRDCSRIMSDTPRRRSRFDRTEEDAPPPRSRFDRRSRSPAPRESESRRTRSPIAREATDSPSTVGSSKKVPVDASAAAKAAAERINRQIEAKKGIQHVDVPPIRSVSLPDSCILSSSPHLLTI